RAGEGGGLGWGGRGERQVQAVQCYGLIRVGQSGGGGEPGVIQQRRAVRGRGHRVVAGVTGGEQRVFRHDAHLIRVDRQRRHCTVRGGGGAPDSEQIQRRDEGSVGTEDRSGQPACPG